MKERAIIYTLVLFFAVSCGFSIYMISKADKLQHDLAYSEASAQLAWGYLDAAKK